VRAKRDPHAAFVSPTSQSHFWRRNSKSCRPRCLDALFVATISSCRDRNQSTVGYPPLVEVPRQDAGDFWDLGIIGPVRNMEGAIPKLPMACNYPCWRNDLFRASFGTAYDTIEARRRPIHDTTPCPSGRLSFWDFGTASTGSGG